jgi:hypothetical protein
VLNGQFLSSNTEVDGSEVIEMVEIVVKGCEGGTKGEVPGNLESVKSSQALRTIKSIFFYFFDIITLF